MSEIRLSDQHRRMILDIAEAIGTTSDELTAAKYETRNPEHARGYIEGFLENASDEKILLAYFVLSMITAKME